MKPDRAQQAYLKRIAWVEIEEAEEAVKEKTRGHIEATNALAHAERRRRDAWKTYDKLPPMTKPKPTEPK